MPRVVVIGDVGGHSDELRSALVRVGADPHTLKLPSDVLVVQVGDLVDRGPDSPGVVAMVQRCLDTQPDQWIQLAGNHEVQHLRPDTRFWHEDLPSGTCDTLRSWWSEGRMWAEAGWELYEPWLRFQGFVPFGQIHGHSSIVGYAEKAWRCPENVRLRATTDTEARHVHVRIGGRRFIGVDPKHGKTPAPRWAPLVLENAEVLIHAV